MIRQPADHLAKEPDCRGGAIVKSAVSSRQSHKKHQMENARRNRELQIRHWRTEHYNTICTVIVRFLYIFDH